MAGERSVTVLLVEDNPDHALLAKLGISRLDEVREVRVAGDGVQALELLEAGPPPDLVLLDLKLPRLDGFAVLERLRAHPSLRGVPVVVLSTSPAEVDRARSVALGASAYLRKPLDPGALRTLLRERWGPAQQVLPF